MRTTADSADPFPYGWRYVREVKADGSEGWRRVPLTLEDRLYPEEEDQTPDIDVHHRDLTTIRDALSVQTHGRPGWRILRDHRVDWQVEGVRPLGPDLVVFEGDSPRELVEGTFRVAQRDARTVLVIEVTSPSTWRNDLGEKVLLYERCGVPLYVIVDGRVGEAGREVQILAFRATAEGYTRVPLDRRGRLWIEPLRFWIAVEEGSVVCYDEKEKRFEEYSTIRAGLSEASAFAEAEKARADTEAARAEAETARAEAETARAEALEQKNRELEAELRRLRGEG
jgi:colicin import membrane protein